MNNLQLSDIDGISYDGPGLFFYIAIACGLLWMLFLLPMIFSIDASNKVLKWRYPFFPVLFGLLSVSLLVTAIWSGVHDKALEAERNRAYEKESAMIVEGNVDAVKDWANSTYVVTVDDVNAKQLLSVTRDYTKHDGNSYINNYFGIPYSASAGSRISPVGDTYVKSVSGEVLEIQLVWDGEQYVLMRKSGGEVERR